MFYLKMSNFIGGDTHNFFIFYKFLNKKKKKKMSSTISLRTKVYHTGMRYIQRAMMARSAGDEKTAQLYMEKFKTLCDFVQETGVDSVPETKNQATLDSIEKMMKERQIVSSSIPVATKAKDKELLGSIKESVDLINKSCTIYSKCIEMNCKPPPLEEKSINSVKISVNKEIPQSDVKISIKNIGGPSKKGITYAIKCYSVLESQKPIESPIFGAGPIDFNCKWSILKRNNEKLMARLATKKSLRFELVMNEKSVFSSSSKVVGKISIPLSLLARETMVSKTYTLEPTDDTPKGEQFSLSFVLEVGSPLVSSSFKYEKVPYHCIKKGSSIEHYENPLAKRKAQQQQNPPKKAEAKQQQQQKPNIQNPANPSKGLKQISELTKPEALQLSKSLPRVAGMQFHVMEEWELERWMSNNVLKQVIDETNQAVHVFQNLGIVTPDKLLIMQTTLKQKLVKNLQDLKSKKLDKVQYLKNIISQVQLDEKEAQTRGLDTIPGKLLIHRAKIMREEYASLMATLKKK